MHRFESPRPEPCPTCGGFHLHCPYCGHPAILWLTPGAALHHHCVKCGGGIESCRGAHAPAPAPAPAPTPEPVPAGGGRIPPPPAPPPGAPDPLERQRQALARAYQASPAAEPEQSAVEVWGEAMEATGADEATHPLVEELRKTAQPLRLLKRSLAVRVPPELVGPLLFRPLWGWPLADRLEHNLSVLSGHPMALELEPTHHLSPCPLDADRLPLRQWAGHGCPEDLNPTTLSSTYRRVFGTDPRKAKGRTTCTYSRRELRLLGVLA